MCTASWAPRPDGYTFCFNRDERRTRAPALPAAVRERDGVSFLAPLDGDFGGTWLAVNQWGLTLALLNRYQPAAAPPPADPRSRGLIILDLIPAPDLAAVDERLRRMPQKHHRPFTLLAIAPGAPVNRFAWDGARLQYDQHAAPGLILTSSAVGEAEVAPARVATFASLPAVTAELLEQAHRSHRPERGPRSVCMHRPEAETQSYSRVDVTADGVTLTHVDRSPCEGLLPGARDAIQVLHLPRHSAGALTVR